MTEGSPGPHDDPGVFSDGELGRARALLDAAQRVVVLTGAGVSAESGVPTFRGEGGLWRSHRPEELATPGAFARDPCLVWEWYAWRRSIVAECVPNAGHRALARFARRRGAGFTLVTQNVDGLHTRAAEAVAAESGPDPRRSDGAGPTLLEVHGALHRDRCSGCGIRTPAVERVDTESVGTLPTCSSCASLLRPDVVWFGEALDPEVIGAAFEAARLAEVCVVVGTSALVHPAAAVPEVTLRSGGAIIEVNLDPTPLTPLAAVSMRGRAAKLVPLLVE